MKEDKKEEEVALDGEKKKNVGAPIFSCSNFLMLQFISQFPSFQSSLTSSSTAEW